MTPTEPNLEYVQAWGQLVPLLQRDPVEAAKLLDDRDRQTLDWLKTHEHEPAAAAGTPEIPSIRVERTSDVNLTSGSSVDLVWEAVNHAEDLLAWGSPTEPTELIIPEDAVWLIAWRVTMQNDGLVTWSSASAHLALGTIADVPAGFDALGQVFTHGGNITQPRIELGGTWVGELSQTLRLRVRVAANHSGAATDVRVKSSVWVAWLSLTRLHSHPASS